MDSNFCQNSSSSFSDVFVTPNGPGEMLISPWMSSSTECLKTSKRHTLKQTEKEENADSASVKAMLIEDGRLMNNKNTNVILSSPEQGIIEVTTRDFDEKQRNTETPKGTSQGRNKLLKSSKRDKSFNSKDIRNGQTLSLPRGLKNSTRTPQSQTLSKLVSLKKSVTTPSFKRSVNPRGLKKVKTPKSLAFSCGKQQILDSSRFKGSEKLVETEKIEETELQILARPRRESVNNKVETPKAPKSPVMKDLKNFVETPLTQMSPQFKNVNKLVGTSAFKKSPKRFGTIKTPKFKDSPKFEGFRELLKTPKVTPKFPEMKKNVRTQIRKSSAPEVLNNFDKPANTEEFSLLGLSTESKIQQSSKRSSNLVETPSVQQSPKQLVETPKDLECHKLVVKTPKVQKSPRLVGLKELVKTPKDLESPKLEGLRKLVKTPNIQASPRVGGLKEMMKTPKVLESPRFEGLRKLVRTPKVQNSPRLGGLKELVKTPKVSKSPRLEGLRKLVRTPKIQKSPRLVGLKELVKTPKVSKSPRLEGLRKLVRTPKVQNSPRLVGLKELVKTPIVLESPRLEGLRKLVKTPKVQRSPRLGGLRELVKTPKLLKSPRLEGLRQLVRIPKIQRSPRLGGLKELVKTPKVLESPRLEGLRKLVRTPKVQKSPRLGGLKELVKTPKALKSPRLEGLRKLVRTPKIQKSPRLGGLRELMKTPKVLKSPKLEGLRKLVRTPKVQKSPRLGGLRELMKTPKVLKSPKLEGLRKLVRTPKVQKSPLLDGLRELVKSPNALESPALDSSKLRNRVRTPKVKKSPKLDGEIEFTQPSKALKSPPCDSLHKSVETPPVQNANLKNNDLIDLSAVVILPNVRGLRKRVQTSNVKKSPVCGLKHLLNNKDCESHEFVDIVMSQQTDESTKSMLSNEIFSKTQNDEVVSRMRTRKRTAAAYVEPKTKKVKIEKLDNCDEKSYIKTKRERKMVHVEQPNHPALDKIDHIAVNSVEILPTDLIFELGATKEKVIENNSLKNITRITRDRRKKFVEDVHSTSNQIENEKIVEPELNDKIENKNQIKRVGRNTRQKKVKEQEELIQNTLTIPTETATSSRGSRNTRKHLSLQQNPDDGIKISHSRNINKEIHHEKNEDPLSDKPTDVASALPVEIANVNQSKKLCTKGVKFGGCRKSSRKINLNLMQETINALIPASQSQTGEDVNSNKRIKDEKYDKKCENTLIWKIDNQASVEAYSEESKTEKQCKSTKTKSDKLESKTQHVRNRRVKNNTLEFATQDASKDLISEGKPSNLYYSLIVC